MCINYTEEPLYESGRSGRIATSLAIIITLELGQLDTEINKAWTTFDKNLSFTSEPDGPYCNSICR